VIDGRVCDVKDNLKTPSFQVSSGGSVAQEPDVDGLDSHWIVAWERLSPSSPNYVQAATVDYDLAATAIPWDPTLLGAQLDAQWTSLTPTSAPCPLIPGASISNRLRLTLGL
jgi:hypothetical protein